MVTDYTVTSVAEVAGAEVEVGAGAGLDEHRVPPGVAQGEADHAVGAVDLERAVRRGRAELVERRAAGADDVLGDAGVGVALGVRSLGEKALVEMVVAVDDDVDAAVEQQVPDRP